jgi:hypothetical protein
VARQRVDRWGNNDFFVFNSALNAVTNVDKCDFALVILLENAAPCWHQARWRGAFGGAAAHDAAIHRLQLSDRVRITTGTAPVLQLHFCNAGAETAITNAISW